jgi:hypothetical protein
MKFIISLICMIGLYQSAYAVTIGSAYGSNLCLDINRGEQSSWRYDSNLEVWPCHGEENQQFSLQPYAVEGTSTIFTIQALGRCLDIDMGFVEDWTHQTNVQLYSCNGGINQQFRLQPVGGGWFTIVSAMDGRCLDIDLNTGNGWRYERNVQLWTCNNGSNQRWRFDTSLGGDIIFR